MSARDRPHVENVESFRKIRAKRTTRRKVNFKKLWHAASCQFNVVLRSKNAYLDLSEGVVKLGGFSFFHTPFGINGIAYLLLQNNALRIVARCWRGNAMNRSQQRDITKCFRQLELQIRKSQIPISGLMRHLAIWNSTSCRVLLSWLWPIEEWCCLSSSAPKDEMAETGVVSRPHVISSQKG